MKHLLRCVKCGAYTFKEEHCGEKTVVCRPPKWSPEDKYAKYRREAKGGKNNPEKNEF